MLLNLTKNAQCINDTNSNYKSLPIMDMVATTKTFRENYTLKFKTLPFLLKMFSKIYYTIWNADYMPVTYIPFCFKESKFSQQIHIQNNLKC
jgi:hypothetical protein